MNYCWTPVFEWTGRDLGHKDEPGRIHRSGLGGHAEDRACDSSRTFGPVTSRSPQRTSPGTGAAHSRSSTIRSTWKSDWARGSRAPIGSSCACRTPGIGSSGSSASWRRVNGQSRRSPGRQELAGSHRTPNSTSLPRRRQRQSGSPTSTTQTPGAHTGAIYGNS